jgi:hypothetical protein
VKRGIVAWAGSAGRGLVLRRGRSVGWLAGWRGRLDEGWLDEGWLAVGWLAG